MRRCSSLFFLIKLLIGNFPMFSYPLEVSAEHFLHTKSSQAFITTWFSGKWSVFFKKNKLKKKKATTWCNLKKIQWISELQSVMICEKVSSVYIDYKIYFFWQNKIWKLKCNSNLSFNYLDYLRLLCHYSTLQIQAKCPSFRFFSAWHF